MIINKLGEGVSAPLFFRMNAAEIRADEILRRLGKNPRGAEIGVSRGALSQRLLVREDLHLLMVDSWGDHRKTYVASVDYHADLSQQEHDEHFAIANAATEWAEDRREIIRVNSVAAARDVENGSLDFVFIDADHSYEGCREDLETWFPKLKPGSLLCGHDYAHPDFPTWGVKRAVDEFLRKNDLPLQRGGDHTWFSRLPGPKPEPSECYNSVVFCCVKWGKKYDAVYVNVLADMVARNNAIPARFVCFTDDPTGLDSGIETRPLPFDYLIGWWQKVYLFRDGTFDPKTRIVFLDLDTVIAAPLEKLICTKGISSDWLQGGYNSAVMVWDQGEHREIWSKFKLDIMSILHGDQDWITQVSEWDSLPADWVVSYRFHAQDWPPVGAKIICFHGEPKPHEITTGWVPEMWSMRGLAVPRYVKSINEDILRLRSNVKINKENDAPAITQETANDKTLLVVGGGPSAADCIVDIRIEIARGADLWALNGAHDWLISLGLIPDAMVILDGRPENIAFVRSPMSGIIYYISTQCDPSIFQALHGFDVKKWTAWLWGVDDKIVIGGGGTVGLKAPCLAYVLGYRQMKLFGYDSSYRGIQDHAYHQPIDDNTESIEVVVSGKKYVTSKWMASQVREFQSLAPVLMDAGCELEIFGTGLLQDICRIADRHAAA